MKIKHWCSFLNKRSLFTSVSDLAAHVFFFFWNLFHSVLLLYILSDFNFKKRIISRLSLNICMSSPCHTHNLDRSSSASLMPQLQKKSPFIMAHISSLTHPRYREAPPHHDWWARSFHGRSSAPHFFSFLWRSCPPRSPHGRPSSACRWGGNPQTQLHRWSSGTEREILKRCWFHFINRWYFKPLSWYLNK